MKARSSAFTLIELLVVIAIIAILAAILFPVFAQAKLAAKKSSAISNVKQTTLSFMIYSTDFDDGLPMAFSRRADGTWRYATVHPAPANAIGNGWDAPNVVAETSNMWHAATDPYRKNWDMLVANGQITGAIPGEVFSNLSRPADMGLTMNGLLHKYNSTSVELVASVPLVWSGYGNVAFKGRAMSNPTLNCGAGWTGDCHFNPGAAAGGVTTGNQTQFFGFGAWNGSYKIWTYGAPAGGVVFGFVDGHAKYQRVGTVAAPAFHTTADKDPYAQYTGTGAGFAYWATVSGNCTDTSAGNTGNFRYVCFFRPDRTQ
jgi:prepilin-type N-terminal cleavage/methylation domain-containing protein